MKTQTGLFIKCDKEADLFHITRQSVERNCDFAMRGRKLRIYSRVHLQCVKDDKVFYLDGEGWERPEHYSRNILLIGLFFKTLIFPSEINPSSGFNYTRDVVL